MSDVKIATRDSYGKALTELGSEFDNLVVLAAVLGVTIDEILVVDDKIRAQIGA